MTIQSLVNDATKTTSTTTTTTTKRPITRTTTQRTAAEFSEQRSTYPPPLFPNFGPFAGSAGAGLGSDESEGPTVGNRVVSAAIGMTRAFGQFLGAAIMVSVHHLFFYHYFFLNMQDFWGFL